MRGENLLYKRKGNLFQGEKRAKEEKLSEKKRQKLVAEERLEMRGSLAALIKRQSSIAVYASQEENSISFLDKSMQRIDEVLEFCKNNEEGLDLEFLKKSSNKNSPLKSDLEFPKAKLNQLTKGIEVNSRKMFLKDYDELLFEDKIEVLKETKKKTEKSKKNSVSKLNRLLANQKGLTERRRATEKEYEDKFSQKYWYSSDDDKLMSMSMYSK